MPHVCVRVCVSVLTAVGLFLHVMVYCINSLGQQPENYDHTVRNIESICNGLFERGQFVAVCTIPLPLDGAHPHYLSTMARNEILTKWIKEYVCCCCCHCVIARL
jgi:hypothetical protein